MFIMLFYMFNPQPCLLQSTTSYDIVPGPYAGLNEGGVVIDSPKGGERR